MAVEGRSLRGQCGWTRASDGGIMREVSRVWAMPELAAPAEGLLFSSERAGNPQEVVEQSSEGWRWGGTRGEA